MSCAGAAMVHPFARAVMGCAVLVGLCGVGGCGANDATEGTPSTSPPASAPSPAGPVAGPPATPLAKGERAVASSTKVYDEYPTASETGTLKFAETDGRVCLILAVRSRGVGLLVPPSAVVLEDGKGQPKSVRIDGRDVWAFGDEITITGDAATPDQVAASTWKGCPDLALWIVKAPE